jgi:hypothetical protein
MQRAARGFIARGRKGCAARARTAALTAASQAAADAAAFTARLQQREADRLLERELAAAARQAAASKLTAAQAWEANSSVRRELARHRCALLSAEQRIKTATAGSSTTKGAADATAGDAGREHALEGVVDSDLEPSATAADTAAGAAEAANAVASHVDVAVMTASAGVEQQPAAAKLSSRSAAAHSSKISSSKSKAAAAVAASTKQQSKHKQQVDTAELLLKCAAAETVQRGWRCHSARKRTRAERAAARKRLAAKWRQQQASGSVLLCTTINVLVRCRMRLVG